jgi:hypothetical protein
MYGPSAERRRSSQSTLTRCLLLGQQACFELLVLQGRAAATHQCQIFDIEFVQAELRLWRKLLTQLIVPVCQVCREFCA